MSFPPNATLYTFNGISFARLLDGDTFTPWFFPETQYTADPVLGGTQVYLDIGGDNVTTLAFRAACLDTTDRQTLKNARNQTGTLANSRGRTATATLVKASPLDGQANQPWIELTFVLRPA